VILIPLHCVAHSHDSRTVLNVRLVQWSKIEKRNRYRYRNVLFFFSLDTIACVYQHIHTSLSEIEFINSRQLPTDVHTGNNLSVRIDDNNNLNYLYISPYVKRIIKNNIEY